MERKFLQIAVAFAGLVLVGFGLAGVLSMTLTTRYPNAGSTLSESAQFAS